MPPRQAHRWRATPSRSRALPKRALARARPTGGRPGTRAHLDAPPRPAPSEARAGRRFEGTVRSRSHPDPAGWAGWCRLLARSRARLSDRCSDCSGLARHALHRAAPNRLRDRDARCNVASRQPVGGARRCLKRREIHHAASTGTDRIDRADAAPNARRSSAGDEQAARRGRGGVACLLCQARHSTLEAPGVTKVGRRGRRRCELCSCLPGPVVVRSAGRRGGREPSACGV